MKKGKIATAIAISAVLAAVPALGGCSGDRYGALEFSAQDTSYVVTSQGGSAVAYGNYVYFINGTRGYDDEDGTNNIWKDAIKGGLYRAELNGTKIDGEHATFESAPDGKGIEFKYTESTDYFDEPVNLVDVTAIAPKTVGTKGYARGGIFIYDNNVFFASPNNSKNATGTVQTTRTDFFMMPLDGGSPKKIYTTSEDVDTSSSAYAFYKYGDSVYLVVNEGENIISVKVNPKKAKVSDPVKFEVGATSVYFPVRDVYYNGIDTNTVEDFVYFVRDVNDDDAQRSGTVIEAMRPDGSENFVVSMTGNTETIESVRDGILFYRTTNNKGETVIAYNSLHDALMEKSPTYAARQQELGDKANKQISDWFAVPVTSSITATYPFRPNTESNAVYFIGVSSASIDMYAMNGKVTNIIGNTGTVQFINNNYLYYSDSSNGFFRVPLWNNMDGFGKAQELATGTTTATLACDVAAGYFTYYAKIDQWADGYTYFLKVDGIEGLDAQAVYARSKADTPTDEQIDAAKNGTEEEETDESTGESTEGVATV